MNLLFLSPHFPDHITLFTQALREQGVRVLGIGDAAPSELSYEASQALADYEAVPSLEDYEAVHRATARLISRQGRLWAIESLNEAWLAVDAKLRTDFNVPGVRSGELARRQSKTHMAAAFRAAGLHPPATRPIRVDDTSAGLIAEFGLPLIAKPDRGVGAQQAYKAESLAELAVILPEAHAAAERGLPFVVQPYVTGTLTSYDGLVDQAGRIIWDSSFVYSDGVLELVRDQQDVLYYTRRQLPAGLVATGQAMVRAFDLRGEFFHAELFETAEGAFIPLEINVRPPGGFSCHLINYGTDADVFRAWASCLLGTPVVPPERHYHAAHVSRRPGIHYRYGHHDVVQRLGPALMLRADLPWIFARAMGSPVYIVRHHNEDELRALCQFVCERMPA